MWRSVKHSLLSTSPHPVWFRRPCPLCRWFVAQRGVRPDSVVVHAPALSQHAQFLHRVKDFAVQEFISELRVERFAIAVLLRRAGFDVQCRGASINQPLAQILGHELWAIVRTKMLRHALAHHHVSQRFDDLGRCPTPLGTDHYQDSRGHLRRHPLKDCSRHRHTDLSSADL